MTISTVDLTDTFDDWRQITNSAVAQLNDIGEYDAITIEGGNIDGTVIGATNPSNATFTTATITTLLISDDSLSGNKISGGTIDSVTVELASAPTIDSHATRKDYVDGEVSSLEDSLIQLSLLFGS